MRRNLRTGLKGRPRPDAMRSFDGLPLDLRRWLAGAALPWSPQSALRIWQRALAESGSVEAAIARLEGTEAAMLRRDAAGTWGRGHPAGEPRG
ncbi:DUF6525 family protein [Neotabrizicola shimadae]|uniref:Uncharacterized protein n=1 Tax=Neotabrizicola shimadae TaxID=2807096 RepID=A0A8G0ZXK2_9RHOB|nr:DUF6525 family protein [Neotabrizicola shimadae]QYZ70568.1 hypothetical protein JO391_03335 [Neotabrizicola shimadae]